MVDTGEGRVGQLSPINGARLCKLFAKVPVELALGDRRIQEVDRA